MLKLSVFAGAVLLLALPGLAHAQISDKRVAELSRCDSTFFRSAAKDRDMAAMKGYRKDGKFAWLEVADRNVDGKNKLTFDTPTNLMGLPVVAYFDEVMEHGQLGNFYNWGFIVRAEPAQIMSVIGEKIYDRSRMLQQGPVFARTDIKMGQFDWMPRAIKSGRLAAENTVERVFLIEPLDDGTSRVGCTVQGTVEPSLLASLRPDLPPKALPAASVTLPPIVNAKVSPDILKVVDAARGSSTMWRPRFKQVEFKKDYEGLNIKTKYILRPLPDDLVQSDQVIDRINMTITTVSFAEIATLLSPPDAVVNLSFTTTALQLKLPERFEPGAQLVTVRTSRKIDGNKPPEDSNIYKICKLERSGPAAELLTGAAGQAHYFECLMQNGSRQREAFVEDLGIMLPAGYFDKKNQFRKAIYTDVIIAK